MSPVQKAIVFAATISMISDIVKGHYSFNNDELIDCLVMLGFDAEKILSLPPVLALHEVCKEFANMDLTHEIMEELASKESDYEKLN